MFGSFHKGLHADPINIHAVDQAPVQCSNHRW